MCKQPWVGWLHAFLPEIWVKGATISQTARNCALVITVETFYFVDLFAFLQTCLGMVLSFLAGRHSKKRKKKAAHPAKTSGFSLK